MRSLSASCGRLPSCSSTRRAARPESASPVEAACSTRWVNVCAVAARSRPPGSLLTPMTSTLSADETWRSEPRSSGSTCLNSSSSAALRSSRLASSATAPCIEGSLGNAPLAPSMRSRIRSTLPGGDAVGVRSSFESMRARMACAFHCASRRSRVRRPAARLTRLVPASSCAERIRKNVAAVNNTAPQIARATRIHTRLTTGAS